MIRNPNGHPEPLHRPSLATSSPPSTVSSRLTVARSDRRALEPRAREIAERILEAPHTVELDEIGAVEIGRLEALIEAIDRDLAERGLTTRGGNSRRLLDLRLRASRRLAEWLDRYGMTPHARAEWAARLARPSFAEEVERRLREMEEGDGDG